MRKNHAVDMGSGAVFSTLLRLGTPALISMFFETLNGLVDSLFVARLGTIPLAAMALALFAEAIFFSYGDTRTPMLAMIAGNLCNIVLDPLLIFGCGLGVEGASLASLPGWLLSGFILRYFLIVFFMACPIVCRADQEGIAPAARGSRIRHAAGIIVETVTTADLSPLTPRPQPLLSWTTT